MAVQCRGETDDYPQGERRANDAREHSMLADPCTHATSITASAYPASPRIGAPPVGRAAASGQHVLDMHHEVLVRELALAKLACGFLLERAGRRVDLIRPLLQRLGGGRRGRVFTCRFSGEDRRWRWLHGRLAGMTWLAPPWSQRHSRRAQRLLDRLWYGQLAVRLIAGSLRVVVEGFASGSRDVQRHHPVASEIAAGRGVLCDDETDQLRWAAERAIKTWTQPRAAHSLRRLARRLADVVADRLAARAAAAGALRALAHALGYCGSVGHLRY